MADISFPQLSVLPTPQPDFLLAGYEDFITVDPELLHQAAYLTAIKKHRSAALAYCLIGPSGCGQTTFARWLWKKIGQVQRPFVPLHCSRLCGVRDLQRYVVQAAGGDLFLQNLEALPEALGASLRFFLQCDTTIRLVASWERDDAPLPGYLKELFAVEVALKPIKQRKSELPQLLKLIAQRYGLEDFPEAERAYIEANTLSLRYEQFIYGLQRMCEISLSAGKSQVDLVSIHQVVSGSKKMLAYEQLIRQQFFTTLMGEARGVGLKEIIHVLEAAIVAKTLQETFNCFAHTARILQLPVNTLYSRYKVLSRHIEVFNRVLGAARG